LEFLVTLVLHVEIINSKNQIEKIYFVRPNMCFYIKH